MEPQGARHDPGTGKAGHVQGPLHGTGPGRSAAQPRGQMPDHGGVGAHRVAYQTGRGPLRLFVGAQFSGDAWFVGPAVQPGTVLGQEDPLDGDTGNAPPVPASGEGGGDLVPLVCVISRWSPSSLLPVVVTLCPRAGGGRPFRAACATAGDP